MQIFNFIAHGNILILGSFETPPKVFCAKYFLQHKYIKAARTM